MTAALKKLMAVGRLLAWALPLNLAPSARAELPVARLQTVFPFGGQAGTTLEVAVEGVDLDDAAALHFSVPGIASEPKSSAGANAAAATFSVTISSNVLPGLYETRVAGRFGISNPRFFTVSARAELLGNGENRTLAQAQPMPLESTVNAYATAAAADFYKFEAQPGQRILLSCQGEPFDSRMKPVLVLFDAQGRELSRDRRGGVIDFRPAEGGFFILEVHDLAYRGGKQYGYRLTATAGPRVDFIFPASAPAGATGAFTVYGRNLPGGQPAVESPAFEKIAAEITAPSPEELFDGLATSRPRRVMEGAVELFDYRLATPGGVAFPSGIAFASDPQVLEQESRHGPDEMTPPQRIAPPCEIQGRFFPEGDVDAYEFEAKKGEVLWLEAFCQRDGQPADPFIVVRRVTKNEAGEIAVSDVQEMQDGDANLGGALFNTATRDPVWRLEAGEDALYRVEARDLFNQRPDPSRIYRLAIRREAPDFRLIALVEPPPTFEKDKREAKLWSSLIRRGETIAIKVLVVRRDNFSGEISLQAGDLPSGVLAPEVIVPAGQNAAWVTITGSDNLTDWQGPIRVIGKARTGSPAGFRVARAATVLWDVGDYNNEKVEARVTQETLLAARPEPVPFHIEPAQAEWPLAAETVPISIRLVRAPEFKEPVKLRAYFDAQGSPFKEWDVDGQAAQTSVDVDPKQAKLSAGPHQLLILAQTKGKMRRVRVEEVPALETAAKAADEQKARFEKEVAEISPLAQKAREELEKSTKSAAEAEEEAKREGAPADAAGRSAAAVAAREAAQKAHEETAAKLKAAEQKKEAATASAKEIGERLQLRDVSAVFVAPIVRLTAAAVPDSK